MDKTRLAGKHVLITGGAQGMITMDQTLTDLVEKRLITREAAREKAKIPENF